MRIKLFESFNHDLDVILTEVDDCLVELRDNGFEWDSEFSSSTNIIIIEISRVDSSINGGSFKIKEVQQSVLFLFDYFDEKYGISGKMISSENGLKPIDITNEDLYSRGIDIKIRIK